MPEKNSPQVVRQKNTYARELCEKCAFSGAFFTQKITFGLVHKKAFQIVNATTK